VQKVKTLAKYYHIQYAIQPQPCQDNRFYRQTKKEHIRNWTPKITNRQGFSSYTMGYIWYIALSSCEKICKFYVFFLLISPV